MSQPETRRKENVHREYQKGHEVKCHVEVEQGSAGEQPHDVEVVKEETDLQHERVLELPHNDHLVLLSLLYIFFHEEGQLDEGQITKVSNEQQLTVLANPEVVF